MVTVGANYLCDFLLSPSSPALTVSADPVVAAAATPTAAAAKSLPGNLRSSSIAAVNAAKAAKAALPAPSDLAVAPSMYSELFNFQSKRTVMSWVGLGAGAAVWGTILWAQYKITRLLNTFNHRGTFEGIYQQIYQKELAAQVRCLFFHPFILSNLLFVADHHFARTSYRTSSPSPSAAPCWRRSPRTLTQRWSSALTVSTNRTFRPCIAS